MDAGELDQALRAAGIPVLGCAVGIESDKSTWRVDFDPSATPQQQAAAAALIQAFTPQTPQQKADVDAAGRMNDKRVRAALLAIYECIPAPTMTKAQALARAIAIYKTL